LGISISKCYKTIRPPCSRFKEAGRASRFRFINALPPKIKATKERKEIQGKNLTLQKEVAKTGCGSTIKRKVSSPFYIVFTLRHLHKRNKQKRTWTN